MPRRTDRNQTEIVKILRSMGVSVLPLSQVGKGCPDLLCSINQKITFLIEVKDGEKFKSQQKLTPLEQKFIDEWRGHVSIINSVKDAVELVNAFRAYQNG